MTRSHVPSSFLEPSSNNPASLIRIEPSTHLKRHRSPTETWTWQCDLFSYAALLLQLFGKSVDVKLSQAPQGQHTTTSTMSLSIPQASQAGLFKSGYNSYDAEDGAIIRNVSCCTCAPRIRTYLLLDRCLPHHRFFSTDLTRTLRSKQDCHKSPVENDPHLRCRYNITRA